MANLFDSIQVAAFDTVANTMGYEATWTPTAGGAEQTAKVLYNGPTEKEKLFSANYNPESLTMEYKLGDLEGLKDSVDDNNKEAVTILGIDSFRVKSVSLKFDGKTLEAKLVRIEA